MNKASLIEAIALEANLSKKEAKLALEAFISTVTKTLGRGERVALSGFGAFSVFRRSAKNGRNPQTGKIISIQAKKVVRFAAGKELRRG